MGTISVWTAEQYDRNAAVMAIDRFRRSAPNPAIAVLGGATNTYREFGDRVSLAAAALRSAGVRRGDRVAFAAGNTPDIVEYLVATLAIGAVFVPLNTRLSAAELQFIVTDARCTVTVADADYARHLAPVQDDLGTALVGCGDADLPAGWTHQRELAPGPVPQLQDAVATEPGDRDPSRISPHGRIDIHGPLDRDRFVRSLDRWHAVGATHLSLYAAGQGDARAHIELIPTLAELAGLSAPTPSTLTPAPAEGAPR